ncbi:PhzF family phenazine biosynthesis protein [Baaleninema simplex]|uniref:PhzF family phenazine biosynthesis protein n=1 Tax=Baaleninema simplex TaxID=2862350 RepID=UPI0003486518|nr:PhzF family phenazine biosynthesis protein [Baaleninema simplex]
MQLLQIDAFTDRPYCGNPAAVCILEHPADEGWMQCVAAEKNLSETAFLHPEADGYRLRWFTPKVEVELCGHATLASAHALWELDLADPNDILYFYTRSGRLSAKRDREWIELDFPASPVVQIEPPSQLLEALGVRPQFVGENVLKDLLVEVATEDEVRQLQPDFAKLTKLSARGVIVTSSSNSEYDFVSRFFAPAAGIDEDPVTGSAHCALAPYWGRKLGKMELTGFQASHRGGIVRVRRDRERVVLGGRAVTVLRGQLLV